MFLISRDPQASDKRTTVKIFTRITSCLFALRYPIIIGMLLVSLPIVSYWIIPSMLQNLFILEKPWHISLIAYMAVTAGWIVWYTSMLIIRKVQLIAKSKSENQFASKFTENLYRHRWHILLALPIIAGVSYGSTDIRWWQRLAFALLGIAVAILIEEITNSLSRFFAKWLDQWRRKTENYSSLSQVFPEEPQAERSDDNSKIFRHDNALFYLIFSFTVYATGFWTLQPPKPLLQIPALGYLILLIIILAWALPMLSYIFDNFRIPTSLALVTASLFMWGLSWAIGVNTDHLYLVEKPSESLKQHSIDKLTPMEVYKRWAKEHSVEEYPSLVVVTASGGGIASAVWTTQVLTSLQAELGDKFGESILFISSVSGGSTGAMYFADAYDESGLTTDQDSLYKVVEAAGSSSLSATAWGMAYPDIWRFFGILPLPGKHQDRAWAMEEKWAEHLNNPDSTLLSWGQDVKNGIRPLVIFNSSVVQTGERMLLTPAQRDDSESGQYGDTRYFLDMYGDTDLSVATAARLSATFPYISPISRPGHDDRPYGEGDGYFLADGGYFDNHGIVTAVEWLQQIIPLARQDERTNIIVIEIRLDALAQETQKNASQDSNWTSSLIGPVRTMLGTWQTTQIQRGNSEWDLLQQANSDITIQRTAFIPWQTSDSKDKKWWNLHNPNLIPLSWHLARHQFERLTDSWKHENNTISRISVEECLSNNKCEKISPQFLRQ